MSQLSQNLLGGFLLNFCYFLPWAICSEFFYLFFFQFLKKIHVFQCFTILALLDYVSSAHEFKICQLSVRVSIMSETDSFQIVVVASPGPYARFVCFFLFVCLFVVCMFFFLFYFFFCCCFLFLFFFWIFIIFIYLFFTNIFLFRYLGTVCEQKFQNATPPTNCSRTFPKPLLDFFPNGPHKTTFGILELLKIQISTLLALLAYVRRAHEIEICPSSIVRPSFFVAIISEPNARSLSNFGCCFPWAIRSDVFLIFFFFYFWNFTNICRFR